MNEVFDYVKSKLDSMRKSKIQIHAEAAILKDTHVMLKKQIVCQERRLKLLEKDMKERNIIDQGMTEVELEVQEKIKQIIKKSGIYLETIKEQPENCNEDELISNANEESINESKISQENDS